jgi:hypothetical protein
MSDSKWIFEEIAKGREEAYFSLRDRSCERLRWAARLPIDFEGGERGAAPGRERNCRSPRRGGSNDHGERVRRHLAGLARAQE